MDRGDGKFKMFDGSEKEEAMLRDLYPKSAGIFKVGEEIEIRGSKFRVKSIKPTERRLKLI